MTKTLLLSAASVLALGACTNPGAVHAGISTSPAHATSHSAAQTTQPFSTAPPSTTVSTPAASPATPTLAYVTPAASPDALRVTYQQRPYVCAFHANNRYDCYPGDTLPLNGPAPALYCSGPSYSVQCSPAWYPIDLRAYTIVTVGGGTYLCDNNPFGGNGAPPGSMLCAPYTGGNPALVNFFTNPLICTPHGSTLDCRPRP